MMKRLRYVYWIYFFGFFACTSPSLQKTNNHIVVNQGNEYPVNFDTLYQKTYNEVYQILKPYESNPNPHFQRRIYDIYFRIGLNSKNLDDRKNMIKSLLNSCGDSLKTSYACEQSLDNLQKVNKDEFDKYDIEQVLNLLSKDYSTYYPHPIQYMPYEDLEPIR